MFLILVSLVVFTLIALVSPRIVPGIKVKGVEAAILVAAIFVVLNIVIGWLLTPVIKLVALPLTCLTLGLFRFLIPMIVNAILLKITDAILDSFELEGWGPAFVMGLLFGLGNLLVSFLS